MPVTKVKGKGKAKAPPQKRGRKPTVHGFQQASMDRHFVPGYIVLALAAKKGSVKEKSDAIDNCTKYVRAKYGSRNPWRKLETDRPEPPPGADTDADDAEPEERAEDEEEEVVDPNEAASAAARPAPSASTAARDDKNSAEVAAARLHEIRSVSDMYASAGSQC